MYKLTGEREDITGKMHQNWGFSRSEGALWGEPVAQQLLPQQGAAEVFWGTNPLETQLITGATRIDLRLKEEA